MSPSRIISKTTCLRPDVSSDRASPSAFCSCMGEATTIHRDLGTCHTSQPNAARFASPSSLTSYMASLCCAGSNLRRLWRLYNAFAHCAIDQKRMKRREQVSYSGLSPASGMSPNSHSRYIPSDMIRSGRVIASTVRTTVRTKCFTMTERGSSLRLMNQISRRIKRTIQTTCHCLFFPVAVISCSGRALFFVVAGVSTVSAPSAAAMSWKMEDDLKVVPQ